MARRLRPRRHREVVHGAAACDLLLKAYSLIADVPRRKQPWSHAPQRVSNGSLDFLTGFAVYRPKLAESEACGRNVHVVSAALATPRRSKRISSLESLSELRRDSTAESLILVLLARAGEITYIGRMAPSLVVGSVNIVAWRRQAQTPTSFLEA